MRMGVLALLGFSFGALSAAGVFTVLAAVGLVPRFVGKTHTARDARLYEDMIVLGTIIGGVCSIYQNRMVAWKDRLFMSLQEFGGAGWLVASELGILILWGLFSGMFVGCLALAIAEILDSIPIFTRRVKFRKGIGILVLGIAIGKMIGSVLYFCLEKRGW